MDVNQVNDNSELIDNYTEIIIGDINKSIDNLASKLIAVMGFSGVLVKFAADMSFEGVLFSVRLLTLLCLLMAIAACGTGLYPRSRGPIRLSPEYLLQPDQYNLSEEKLRLVITRHQAKKIPDLHRIQSFRGRCLTTGIGLIIAASILSTLHALILSIS